MEGSVEVSAGVNPSGVAGGSFRDAIRPAGHPCAMTVRARLLCSDDDCSALYEALGSATEVEGLGCECGYGLQALGWPHPVEPTGQAERGLTLVRLDR